MALKDQSPRPICVADANSPAGWAVAGNELSKSNCANGRGDPTFPKRSRMGTLGRLRERTDEMLKIEMAEAVDVLTVGQNPPRRADPNAAELSNDVNHTSVRSTKRVFKRRPTLSRKMLNAAENCRRPRKPLARPPTNATSPCVYSAVPVSYSILAIRGRHGASRRCWKPKFRAPPTKRETGRPPARHTVEIPLSEVEYSLGASRNMRFGL